MDKKKFRWSKAKAKKCMDGAISVFLCLLITPFLTVTLALIEYARYQEVMEIANELMELTELFALADYDPYIHTRFGMLALSQDGMLGDGLENVLVENAKITGNQLVPSNVSVSGEFTLQDTNILRQQLVDFSQLNSPTALVMENLGLKEMLDHLKELDGFSTVTDTVDKLATATEKTTEAAKALQSLSDNLNRLGGAITDAQNQANDLISKFTSLVNSLGERGITLPASPTPEDIEAAVQDFADAGYLDQIKDIYTKAKELKDSLESIKSIAGQVKNDVARVKTAVQEASEAIGSIGSDPSDQGQSISSGMTNTVDSVIQEMDELVENTLNEIKDDTLQLMEDTADKILDTLLDDSGLSNVVGRYSEILSGSYINMSEGTISDHAKQDIKDFIIMARDVYNPRSGGPDVEGSIRSFFHGRFYPNISFNYGEFVGKINNILDQAVVNGTESAKNKLKDLIERLGNLARKIFNLDFFTNPHLNSVVTLNNADENGAQDFVDAVNRLLNAVKTFGESIGSFRLISALEAIWDLMVAIKDMIKAIITQIGDFLDGIIHLFDNLYERVIISGYMANSLPCRTDASRVMSGGVLTLNGESLTGFPYDDIPRGENINTFKGAELEYVYKGTNDEKANQSLTFWDLYFLRLLLDLPSIFTDGEVAGLAAAANIAAWVVYIIYILVEPFLDTLLLVNGGDAPFIKTKCWVTATGLPEFISRFGRVVTSCEDLQAYMNTMVEDFTSDMNSAGGGGGGGGVGMLDTDYKNYLLIMLMIRTKTETQVQRLGNLIDLEATQYYQKKGKSFDITHTYTALELSADMTFNPFVDVGLLTGNGPLNVSGRMTRIVSY